MEDHMKYVRVLGAIVLATGLAACGGSSSSNSPSQPPANPATGAWTETLANASGQQLGMFSFSMMQNGTALSGNNMNFSNMATLGPCFGTGTVMTGQMGPGMMNGGDVNWTMSWTPPGSAATNTLVMKGTMGMGMGSGNGTFTLTGQTPGCTSQTGTFSMSRITANMMM